MSPPCIPQSSPLLPYLLLPQKSLLPSYPNHHHHIIHTLFPLSSLPKNCDGSLPSLCLHRHLLLKSFSIFFIRKNLCGFDLIAYKSFTNVTLTSIAIFKQTTFDYKCGPPLSTDPSCDGELLLRWNHCNSPSS